MAQQFFLCTCLVAVHFQYVQLLYSAVQLVRPGLLWPDTASPLQLDQQCGAGSELIILVI